MEKTAWAASVRWRRARRCLDWRIPGAVSQRSAGQSMAARRRALGRAGGPDGGTSRERTCWRPPCRSREAFGGCRGVSRRECGGARLILFSKSGQVRFASTGHRHLFSGGTRHATLLPGMRSRDIAVFTAIIQPLRLTVRYGAHKRPCRIPRQRAWSRGQGQRPGQRKRRCCAEDARRGPRLVRTATCPAPDGRRADRRQAS